MVLDGPPRAHDDLADAAGRERRERDAADAADAVAERWAADPLGRLLRALFDLVGRRSFHRGLSRRLPCRRQPCEAHLFPGGAARGLADA